MDASLRARLISFCDPASISQYAGLFADAANRAAKARFSIANLEKQSGSEHYLLEHVREAEQSLRIMIKVVLDVVNRSRDAGFFERTTVADGSYNLLELFVQSHALSKRVPELSGLPDPDGWLFPEERAALSQHVFATNSDERTGQIQASIKGPSRTQSASISMARQPWGLGRVSSSEFFAPYRSLSLRSSTNLAIRRDVTLPVDGYASLIEALKYLRDSAARYVRITEYFGRPHVRGELPLLAGLLVGALIVAVVGLVGGFVCEAAGGDCEVFWQMATWGGIIGGILLVITGAGEVQVCRKGGDGEQCYRVRP